MKKFLLLLVVSVMAGTVSAQNRHLVDSLQALLKVAKQDTSKAEILYQLCKAYRKSKPDKALEYAEQSLALSKQLGYHAGLGNAYNIIGAIKMNKGDFALAHAYFDKYLKLCEEKADTPGLAIAFHNIGNIYYIQGNYTGALKFHFEALEIKKKLGNKQGMASSYNCIGSDYLSQGNYPEALKYHFQALKIQEELGNKGGMAAVYGNIGIIYAKQGNYPEALKNHLASLRLNTEAGDKKGMADCYTNIGILEKRQGNYPNAFRNYQAALGLSEELGDKSGIGRAHNNIGSVYLQQGRYPEAMREFSSSLKIFEEIGFNDGIANAYNSIGVIYTRQKQYAQAQQSLEKALALSKKLGSLEDIQYSFSNLATLDSARGNFLQALAHYKMYIAFRDSIYNKENTKKSVQLQMQYEFDKKEAVAKAEQEKLNILAEKKLQTQKWLRNGFIIGFAVVLLFALVFLYQRRKIGREKRKSEELLLNILPHEVAEELKSTGSARARSFDMVSVMFTDFKDFTRISEKVSAELLVDELHFCFSAFDAIMEKHKIEKIKTIGDSYLCASGLPVLNQTHARDLVEAAIEVRDFILERKKVREAEGKIPFELRIGIHTGPLVAGIVGIKKFAYDIWGDTVNIAARMEQTGEPGKINISGSTFALVKDAFTCTYRGKIEAKNKGGIDMYFVEGGGG